MERKVRTRTHVTRDTAFAQESYNLRVRHHAYAVLNSDGTELFHRETNLISSTVLRGMRDTRDAMFASSRENGSEVLRFPCVGRAAHSDSNDVIDVMSENQIHGRSTGSGRKVRRDVRNETPRHAGSPGCTGASIDNAVVDRSPFLPLFKDVAGCRHMELDVYHSLGDCQIEIAFRCQREVLWIAEKVEYREVPFEEQRKAVKAEPRFNTSNVFRRWAHAVTLSQGEHGRRVDCSFQMDVQLSLGQRTHDIARERISHPTSVL